jgi:hypothetical protein
MMRELKPIAFLSLSTMILNEFTLTMKYVNDFLNQTKIMKRKQPTLHSHRWPR